MMRHGRRFGVTGGSLEDEWFYATATPLPDGRVFIAGGYNSAMLPSNQSWMYRPATERPRQTGPELAGPNGPGRWHQ